MPMKDKVFIDSNVWIYLYDLRYPEKQKTAINLIESMPNEKIVISTQVLKEMFAVLIKKIGYSIEDWKHAIRYYENYLVVDTPLNLIQTGLNLMLTHSISFWDSLIVAAADSANCSRIITEDLNHGQEISGMEIFNPFFS